MTIPYDPQHPTTWSQWALATLPTRLGNGVMTNGVYNKSLSINLSSQFAGITQVLIQDVLFQAMSEAILHRCQQLPISPDDVLPFIGIEANLPQYVGEEPSVVFRGRLQDKWNMWNIAGTSNAIKQNAQIIGLPIINFVYDFGAGGNPEYGIPQFPSSSEWWSQFIVVITLPAPMGQGADCNYLYNTWVNAVSGEQGQGYLIDQQHLDTIRFIINKFKPANWICREIIICCPPNNLSTQYPLYDLGQPSFAPSPPVYFYQLDPATSPSWTNAWGEYYTAYSSDQTTTPPSLPQAPQAFSPTYTGGYVAIDYDTSGANWQQDMWNGQDVTGIVERYHS